MDVWCEQCQDYRWSDHKHLKGLDMNNGGPVFDNRGISLRDLMALVYSVTAVYPSSDSESKAKQAYELADAMLAEREKRK